MREVANFMQMYPAYTLRNVMDEYAITFFSMLNEGYRLRYRHYSMLANIVSVPYMEQEARAKFLKQLMIASKDQSDILFSSTASSSTEDIKKALGG